MMVFAEHISSYYCFQNILISCWRTLSALISLACFHNKSGKSIFKRLLTASGRWALPPQRLPKRLFQKKRKRIRRTFLSSFALPPPFPIFLKCFAADPRHMAYIFCVFVIACQWSEGECGPPGPLNLGRHVPTRLHPHEWRTREIAEFVPRHAITN